MYRFKSKADGDLILLDPAADALLRIIGREPAAKGILELAALPAAMAALEQAVAADEAVRKSAAQDEPADAPGGGAGGRDKVSLRQRAWPLLEMMRRSHAAGVDIVWGV